MRVILPAKKSGLVAVLSPKYTGTVWSVLRNRSSYHVVGITAATLHWPVEVTVVHTVLMLDE